MQIIQKEINSNTIIGCNLPNIPWEEKRENCKEVIWRSEKNPIISRNSLTNSYSIYNSAVVPYEDGFVGVFRVDDKSKAFKLHSGRSKDGVTWEIEGNPIEFVCENEEVGNFIEGYDPRVVKIEDKYYVTWCNSYHGPTIGVAYTYDFKVFYQMENAFMPCCRNGVLFPRKINGKFMMLNRPSDMGHTPFGDIFLLESSDLTYWGRCRHVFGPEQGSWQSVKVGAGPIPIETEEGWLLFYHGVWSSCNGFNYCMGAAILDIDEPWKVKYRTKPCILSPIESYECTGDVPNVIFPCASLVDAATGRITIYYGAADTVTCTAYTQVDELLRFIKENTL